MVRSVEVVPAFSTSASAAVRIASAEEPDRTTVEILTATSTSVRRRRKTLPEDPDGPAQFLHGCCGRLLSVLDGHSCPRLRPWCHLGHVRWNPLFATSIDTRSVLRLLYRDGFQPSERDP